MIQHFLVRHLCWAIISLTSIISISCTQQETPVPELVTFDLISPQNESVDTDLNPVFHWSAAGSHELTYSISVWGDKNRSMLIYSKDDLVDTVHTADFSLLGGGTYYWSVSAIDKQGVIKEAKDSFSFRTRFNKPLPSPDISTYYVSTDGIDQPWAGSIESPFRSVSYASKMVPEGEGDEIRISKGTFMESEPIRLGLATHLIGEGPNKTVLKSSGVTLMPGTNPSSSGYKLDFDGSLIQAVSEKLIQGSGAVPPSDGDQKIYGFTIDGSSKSLKAGIWVENRDNVEISHITIKDCDYRGAVVTTGNASGTQSYFLSGIKIHDCLFENSGKDLEDETLGNLCLSSLNGAEIYNITIEDQEGYGIKFIHRGYFKNCKFYDIKTELNENDAKWGEKISVELWNLGPGNELYNISSNTWLSMVNDTDVYATLEDQLNLNMHHIKIIDRDRESTDRGLELAVPHSEISHIYIENKAIAVAVWNMGRDNLLIRNCVFRNTKYHDNWAGGPGIYIDNSKSWVFKDIHIFNNIFDQFNYPVVIKGQVENVEIRNNVIVDTGILDVLNQSTSVVSFTHNLKFTEEPLDWKLEGQFQLDQNLLDNPQFPYTGNFWSGYYHPINTSPLIDSGIDVGIPFKGLAPDIGHIEMR